MYKLKFNDGSSIDIHSYSIGGYNGEGLSIVVQSEDYTSIKNMFSDTSKTESMEISVQDIVYNHFFGITKIVSIHVDDIDKLITVTMQPDGFQSQINVISKHLSDTANSLSALNQQVNPTYDIDAMELDELKQYKISVLSKTCEDTIYAGVDVILSNMETKHFSLTANDQSNLTVINGFLASGIESYPYHADGEQCRLYSSEDLKLIIHAAISHILYQTTLCNGLLTYIRSIDNMEIIKNITYDIDQLPTEYQENINTLTESISSQSF